MKKLPVIGTSAASTAFCYEQVDGPGGLHLFVDGNGKITRDNGTLAEPRPNAFSIRNRDDCPGKTPTCSASCYVDGIRQHASDTYTLYEHNSATIRQVLDDDELANAWALRLAGWIGEHVTSFRWHVSGDVFNARYAAWIADVCREAPEVEFWIYTRSFDEPILAELAEVSTLRGGNLALNLSADRDNYHEAARAAYLYGYGDHSLRVCYLTSAGELPAAGLEAVDVIFPDYRLRAGTEEGRAWFAALAPHHKKMVCPVDYQGKDEVRRCGPCARCLT